MKIQALIDGLSRPGAYPHPVDGVEVRQTHISVVFLAGDFAYKIKKALDLGFLDFTDLERRHHFCDEEVRLNRRLAPQVYLGVAPVKAGAGGTELRIEGPGETVEWAVRMRRLPEAATLENRILAGSAGPEWVGPLAERLAAFHRAAARGPEISRYGDFEVVRDNWEENFEQSLPHLGETIDHGVFERLHGMVREELERRRHLIRRRASEGVPRDTHGDLRLEHVYLFPEREPPDDLVIIDCIEFNERFRYADPVADVAFLLMDLCWRGRRDLADTLAERYLAAASDPRGGELLPLYVAYRAAVRGKVEGFKLDEEEIGESGRLRALSRARGHWLLALDQLAAPRDRPGLVLVGGLPGTGKSTVASYLARHAGFNVVRSDRVRKSIAGVAPDTDMSAEFGEGIYSPSWTEATYRECLERTTELLFRGGRVAVDASFGSAARRAEFLEAAGRRGVRSVFLRCRADPEEVRRRLRDRRDDVSDASWAIYREAADRWEEGDEPSRARTVELPPDLDPERTGRAALEALRERGLWS